MCNCGGSSKVGAPAGGQRVGRQVGPGAPGYTWNGPQTRPAEIPAAAPAAPATATPAAKPKTTRTRTTRKG